MLGYCEICQYSTKACCMNTSRIARIRNGDIILKIVCLLLKKVEKKFHAPNFNLQYIA